MSGIEDEEVKVGVEAYILKRITEDLPLHPILVALKWDHLTDLKLADSNFRTSARIDMLLGAEVFTSIFCDSRRTGPEGTPSTINTCFGWVLFGNILGSDVVNVVKFTLRLEQDELRELSGSRRTYAAILIADEEKDLWYLHVRQRNEQVFEGQQLDASRRESNHQDCGIQHQVFGRYRISQGVIINRFTQGNAGEALG